ncbi:major facilitator superfamily domain-containing protein [Multifurca ochricompacta]|uniref:Major facilitator superfamily domain-containing protein n=1 Tax=Multifurca ochricompacta TaxID=376703 RepID=A0AAD4M8Y7_9AGAM|nr:major facilitator superfamily domain-containing protein [Multifurca ochricompacta]
MIASLEYDPNIITPEHRVTFEDGDKQNPTNFSRERKWVMTLVVCLFTGVSAAAASSYNSGFPSMIQDLKCTEFQATIGLSVYPLGFGLGRRPLYLISGIGFMMMHILAAKAESIQTVIVARLLGGAFGSTGATMVGGTIADLWQPKERGLPMSLFALFALGATGLGPVAGSWIEANPHFQWRWIQWFHAIAAGVVLVALVLFTKETRTAVVLTAVAKKLRKKTGDKRYLARAELEKPSIKRLLIISCTRPLYFLLTEPVVTSISVWVGFAWGVLYCMIESIAAIFQSLHHFNTGETGTVFLAIFLGSLLGFCTNFHQERLYRANVRERGPEARLQWACIAAIMFPAGMLVYAWTSLAWVPWIVMTIGMVVFMWATFIIYLAAFTYLADCYGTYASSAIAAQSLSRNLLGMAFPLFTRQMFAALTYKWGNVLFGCVALLMVPIPWILFHYGPAIRSRSKVSQRTMEH